MKSLLFKTWIYFLCAALSVSCSKQHEKGLSKTSRNDERNAATATTSSLSCTQQTEQTDYSIYRMCSDGTRVGDVAAWYDSSAGNCKIYFLKDIWNSSAKHPFYGFTTSNYYSYTQTGAIINSNAATCAQDNAVGTGSLVKNGSKYYFFYTGYNDNTTCGTHVEGIMLTTATSPTATFTKNTSFATLYAPTGVGYDENNNCRDPFVTWDAGNNQWMMLVTARKNVGGTWKGVIVKYTSANLMNWTHAGVFYDGGTSVYFNMECPSVFKIGSNYYLLFSDQSLNDDAHKYVYYRKGTSLNGPWSLPTGLSRIDANAFYAAKAVNDKYGDNYLFGWCHINVGNTDAGAWTWGGNLITHKIYALANGDIAQSIPHTIKTWLETTPEAIVKNSQWGNVTKTNTTSESYHIVSTANNDVANVIYDPVNRAQYLITTTFSYANSAKDFGFMIGACDGFNEIFQLRFVPSQNKLKFEKKHRDQLDNNPDNEIPLTLAPNTNYKVQIVIENSVVVMYINDQVAFTNRIYKATNTNWGIFTDNSDVTFNNITVTHP